MPALIVGADRVDTIRAEIVRVAGAGAIFHFGIYKALFIRLCGGWPFLYSGPDPEIP